MPAALRPARTPWSDRFSTPTPERLLAQYDTLARALADGAVTDLTQIAASPPSLEWLGLGWKWTLVYRVPGEAEPCAYIVPTPLWPTLALPVPLPIAEDIINRRGSKYLRDTLMHATIVGQTRWAQWSIQGKAQMTDVLKLCAGIVQGQPV